LRLINFIQTVGNSSVHYSTAMYCTLL